MTPTASCVFIGRTGNQLWQIAATINYALKHGMNYAFPQRTLSERDWPMSFKNLPNYRGAGKVWQQPDDGGFYEIPRYSNGILLRGFFQSYKYINHPETLPTLKRVIGYEDHEPKKGIAVHVRRGDYLIHKDGFPPLENSYYFKAFAEFVFRGHSINYHMFSDDIEWCKKTFGPGEAVTYHETSPNPVDDLFEMSRYEHNIIANSSYSYWAAMLNPNPNKIVICPHYTQYYGPANRHLKTVDLYPPEWHQIKF